MLDLSTRLPHRRRPQTCAQVPGLREVPAGMKAQPARPCQPYLRRVRQEGEQLQHVLHAMPGAKASTRTCFGLSNPRHNLKEIERLPHVPSATPDAM
jgi:hypothetical protein